MNIVSSTFNNDIIIVGQQPWDTDIGNNVKDIALELSKTNRVLFVNSPLNRITMWRGKGDPKVRKRVNIINKKEEGLIQINENLWTYYPDCITESINWVQPVQLFNFLNRRNNKIFAGSILKAINTLGFNVPILFNDNEMFQGFYLKEYLNPKLSIYYARDYMIAVDYWKKHGIKLEPLLIAKSDICFTNSEYLANYCQRYNPRSFNVGQGCDVDFFKNVSIDTPTNLTGWAKPLIGYVGALNSLRLDIEIIDHIAFSYPDYTIVLVGAEDEIFKQSKLHKRPNILFLGQQPVSSLPNYINSFDLCINPQLINDVTIGNYPRKIDEYLVLGKPVVATRTITMGIFDQHVYLADSKEEYVDLIKKALEENSESKSMNRKNFAYTHTWKTSVDDMKSKISTLLAESVINV